MLRIFKFTSIMFLFLLLTACVSQASAKNQIVTINIQDAGKTITLHSGDSLVIDLDGNPSTGYTWVLANQDLKTVTQKGDAVVKESDSKLIGSPQQTEFTFTASSTGTETLTLNYLRTWEKGTAPTQTFEVTIVVK
jgi:inhibitor of cysteine peptidase